MPERLRSFADRLARIGLPAGHIERAVRELAEHRLDLKHEGWMPGCPRSRPRRMRMRSGGYSLPANGWLGFAVPLVAFGLIHASGLRKHFLSRTTIE